MWIKCSDKLPDGDEACLCWNDRRKCVEIFLFWNGKWSTLDKNYVTHWMPLPDSPKSDNLEEKQNDQPTNNKTPLDYSLRPKGDINREFDERNGRGGPRFMDLSNANTFPRGFLG